MILSMNTSLPIFNVFTNPFLITPSKWGPAHDLLCREVFRCDHTLGQNDCSS